MVAAHGRRNAGRSSWSPELAKWALAGRGGVHPESYQRAPGETATVRARDPLMTPCKPPTVTCIRDPLRATAALKPSTVHQRPSPQPPEETANKNEHGRLMHLGAGVRKRVAVHGNASTGPELQLACEFAGLGLPSGGSERPGGPLSSGGSPSRVTKDLLEAVCGLVACRRLHQTFPT